MAIRITRNEEANCINFVGSSNPAYFNACLSAVINADDPTRVDIINDVRTQNEQEVQYEFYAVNIEDFADRDGNSFADAQAMVDYINDQANVLGVSDVGADLNGVAVNFRLDDTQTSIIMDNGSSFGVNTIKAVPDTDGTVHIHAIGAGAPDENGEANEHKYFEGLEVGNASINGIVIPGGANDIANALNELFTVGPFEAIVITDPAATVIADVQGIDAEYTLEGNTAMDPAGDDVFANSSSGNYAGLKSVATINQTGEYFTFDIRNEGQIGFGLIHTQASYDDGHFTGNSNYADPTSFAVSNSAHYGFQFSHWFHPTPNGSWTNYGASTGFIYGPGWSGWESKDEWLAGDAVKVKVGIDENGFIAISTLQDDDETWILHARTSYPVPQGSEFHLGIKAANSVPRVYTAPKVHLRAVDETPTAIGDTSIDIFGDAVGTLAGGITVSSASGHNDGIITSESISEIGEYFEVEVNDDESHMIGLFYEGDYDVATVVADTDDWPLEKYFFLGGKANTNEQLNNTRYKSGSGSSIVGASYQRPVGCDKYRVGFDADGRATIWSSTNGTDFVVSLRDASAAPSGEYKLMWKGVSDGSTLESVEKGQLSFAPVMNFRFIESPDGYYSYPLFATQEEADYYELQESGSDNGSHTHTYPDDPTFTTWYMPNTAHQMDYELTPTESGVTTFEGNAIVWTEITSLTNADLAPSALTLPDYTLVEASTSNIAVQPVDQVPVATVTGLPAGLTFQGGSIVGTAPYVAADTDYTITVSRSNNYGTTTQTFTLTVTDNASLGDFTHFTEFGGNLVQPDRMILDADALVQHDTVLSQGQELTYSYGAIPPSIGILSSTGETTLASLGTNQLGSAGYNFAETSMWDLRYVTFGGYIGGNSTKFNLVGWSDNTTQTGSEGDLVGGEFKLEYANDGYIRLYYNGVLKLTSASTFTGDQTLTLAAFDDQAQSDVYIPSNWTILTTGAGSTTPPAGFADPLLSGEMANTTLMGDNNGEDAAASLTDTLDINHRYIFPQAWLETNVLPYMTGSSDEVFFGVPASGASWTDVGSGDWDAGVRLEGRSSASHYSKLLIEGAESDTNLINSDTDAFYDYAVEWDGTDLHVIACNIGDINSQPSVSNGGAFSRTASVLGYTGQTGSLPLAVGVDGGAQVNLSAAGLQQIRTPFGQRDILVGEASGGGSRFSTLQPDAAKYDEAPSGHAPSSFALNPPTVNAGYTYRFIYHPSMEADDFIEFRLASDNATVYTTGVTTFGSGDPSFTGEYKGVEFAVPADAPPLKVFVYNSYQSGYYSAGKELPISGSTYVTPVTGITQEGPAANQTGSNLFDAGDHGWLSIDEQLGAGERLVMNTAFLADLVDAMPDDSEVKIGLKDGAWASTTADTNFEGALRFIITRNSSASVDFRAWSGASSTTLYNTSVAGITSNSVGAFFDLTNSGNNIRFGIRSDATNNTNDVSSSAYAEWSSSYKVQTGDQGYGLTNADIMVLGDDKSLGGTGSMDTSDVDWTGLREIAVPTAPAALTTPWTKALDFSGSSERTQQVNSSNLYTPLKMAGSSSQVALPVVSSNTVSSGYPWATACVFKIDGNSSNQHIWNLGEGAGSNDDNIYLRVDANQRLYFGWGRSGEINECYIHTLSSAWWYGIYVGFNGARYGAAGSTASRLDSIFDIRLTSSIDSFASLSELNELQSGWTHGASSTGARMDRQIDGDMTIGGRGSNRNFHGKVASMVATTLKCNSAMPVDAEINMMLRDPIQWLTDYKAGQTYRRPSTTSTHYSNFQLGTYDSSYATQVWLMGDGPNDGFAQIRNYVWSGEQNRTPMNMVSMVSNDIENVTILGLT